MKIFVVISEKRSLNELMSKVIELPSVPRVGEFISFGNVVATVSCVLWDLDERPTSVEVSANICLERSAGARLLIPSLTDLELQGWDIQRTAWKELYGESAI